MIEKTILNAAHRDMGGKMVEFGGWDMPLHYGSQKNEHHIVRTDVGMFDVSHMCVVDLQGTSVRDFLRFLLANDVSRLTSTGKALYSCMLNPEGGVIDDLICYYMNDSWFRLVVNAGTAKKDIAWIQQNITHYDVTMQVRDDLAMIAVQGPNAIAAVKTLIDESASATLDDLPVFTAMETNDLFIARTGYTGENGVEVIVPEVNAEAFWYALAKAGVKPIGLGARDTLRLEAGMNLYGSDMDETVSPLEAGLAWTIVLDDNREFIGKDALLKQKQQGCLARFVGLVLEGKGVLRNHQKLLVDDKEVGEITSGGFSPTMNKSIAFARIQAGDYEQLSVDIRGKHLPVIEVKPPFVRNGKIKV